MPHDLPHLSLFITAVFGRAEYKHTHVFGNCSQALVDWMWISMIEVLHGQQTMLRRLSRLPAREIALTVGMLLAVLAAPVAADDLVRWGIHDITLRSSTPHPWWEFPVTATFTHAQTGTQLTLEGCWDGEDRWLLRFTPPLAGKWTYITASGDNRLNRQQGQLQVREARAKEIATNMNLRGQVRISDNGRYFQYADGTPTFILADTLWAANTLRCGLGENEDGPFFQYLDDRRSKGFTAVLMESMRGFGDTDTEIAGQRNEGGYPFHDNEVERLNPFYFQALDHRMRAIHDRGLLMAISTTWFAKRHNCFFDRDWAPRISAYVAVRYGAFNSLWSLTGEYQYTFRDCKWTAEDINAVGNTVQQHNPYHHPLSIHPGGGTKWKPPHNVQSSKPFQNSGWLDHHWLQTGQSIDRIRYITIRCRENRALEPVRPVFCSESYYEVPPDIDPDGAYHARLQAWSAFLNGAAGYGYGAYGVWQFFDPEDPHGETGKRTRREVPWRQALQFSGSAQMRHVRHFLASRDWWRIEPANNAISLDGQPNTDPTEDDLTPPRCGTIDAELYIVYIPRGNAARELEISIAPAAYQANWLNPRSGKNIPLGAAAPSGIRCWAIPPRPKPADKDWVLVVERDPRAG